MSFICVKLVADILCVCNISCGYPLNNWNEHSSLLQLNTYSTLVYLLDRRIKQVVSDQFTVFFVISQHCC
jgi:hypothetical protein